MLTLSQFEECFSKIEIKHSAPDTYNFLLKNKLLNNFKQALQGNAALFHYSLDLNLIFELTMLGAFDFLPQTLNQVLISKWQVYQSTLVPACSTFGNWVSFLASPFLLWSRKNVVEPASKFVYEPILKVNLPH